MNATEQKALKLIKGQKLIQKGDNILVAFSGGPDSAFLLHLLNQFKKLLGIELAAAHINHNLRGGESERDQQFAKQFCEKEGIKFYSISVSVKKYAEGNKISLEEAGRELRYSFLQQLSEEKGFTKIATAHNLNDNAETMLFNFLKGTGVSGLKGIPIVRDNIIRPILGISREEIESYIKQNKIEFVTDSSNKENEFKRNFIRNKIVPLIKEEINPSFEQALFRSAQIFSNTETVLEKYTGELIEKYVCFEPDNFKIKLSLLENHPAEVFGEVVKECIGHFTGADFSFNDYLSLMDLTAKQTGTKIFISNNLTAIRESEQLLIREVSEEENIPAAVVEIGTEVDYSGITLMVEEIDGSNGPEFSNEYELVDAENISGGLQVRRWTAGDKFIPLGMKGFKMVADFLPEQKVPAGRKRDQLVLTDDKNIIWVIGHRVDDRYKITNKTKRIFKLRII